MVGIEAEDLGASAPMLRRRDHEVNRVPSAGEALRAMRARRYDLVVCRYPLPDLLLRDFVAGGRAEVGPSHASAFLVVASPGMEVAAREAVAAERCEVVGRSAAPAVLNEALGRLLEASPRVAPRIDLRLRLTLDSGDSAMPAKVANISSTGMLVEGLTELAPGVECGFELTVPDPGGPVSGRAEVVRHTSFRRELLRGIALRFVAFESGGRERLQALLRTESSGG